MYVMDVPFAVKLPSVRVSSSEACRNVHPNVRATVAPTSGAHWN